jgi:hypothetical protein
MFEVSIFSRSCSKIQEAAKGSVAHREAHREHVPPKERKVVRSHVTGGRALLDSEDVEFDIYKRACKFMELSCLKMMPEQAEGVKAGGVHLWQLRRQANSFSNWFAIREFQCPMRHMYKCNVRLRIVEGPGFMQLEQCGLHDKHSHVTAKCRTSWKVSR